MPSLAGNSSGFEPRRARYEVSSQTSTPSRSAARRPPALNPSAHPAGSAMVTIIVHPVAIRSAVVELLSWFVTEVPLTPKLERFLLQTNYRLPLGALALDDDA